jgi:hypothetical protein
MSARILIEFSVGRASSTLMNQDQGSSLEGKPRMKKLRLILLGAVVAMGSAVASASAGATSTVGQQYLHDVAPLNAAVTMWIA